jgi:flagellar motor switch protein FliN/FliY
MSEALRTEFANLLARELAAAVGTTSAASIAMTRETVSPGAGWVMTLAVTGARKGSFSAWIDRAGAIAVMQLLTGAVEESDDSAVADMLLEMWSQAASSVCLKPPFDGLEIAVSGPVGGAGHPTDRAGHAWDLGGARVAKLLVYGDFEARAIEVMPPARVTTQTTNMDVVLDMELPLIVRFGRTVMSLKALAALGPGSIVSMGRSPDDPVELLVSDRVIARGEVVIVGGNYGVRVTQLVGPADRAKGLEA